MTAHSQHGLAEPLLAQVTGRFSPQERDQVRNAYAFAARWHQGQRRKSGDPFITHPLAVAEAAAAAGLDCVMVCAALLHDVPSSLMLPAPARARYLEEWAAELRAPADQHSRRRFAWQLMLGLPRLSILLRRARNGTPAAPRFDPDGHGETAQHGPGGAGPSGPRRRYCPRQMGWIRGSWRQPRRAARESGHE
jgi:HD domain